MSNLKLPIVAAIPAHNAAHTLPALLDELIKQKYDDIFVLDDASTDDTVKIVRSYGPKVKLIENNENVGSGANRNRVIGHVGQSIIHFIDADMKLNSKNTPQIIMRFNWPENIAYIGGMVRNPDGTQNPFNFGSRPHLLESVFKGGLQFIIWQIGLLNEKPAKYLRKLFAPALRGFPNIYEKPRPRRTYWVAESNRLVKSDFFTKHGGFDPRFRYSEIEDLSLRMHRLGFHAYFYPDIDATHNTLDNILRSGKKRYTARKQFHRKHGRLAYLLPPLSDYLAGRKTQKRYHK